MSDSSKVSWMRSELSYYMTEILRRLFIPGSKITVLVRPPGDVEREVLQTNDDLDEVARAIERSKQREST